MVKRNKKYSNTCAWYHTLNGRIKTLIASARRRAYKKGIKFELTIEWLEDKFIKQKGRCLLTNLELEIKEGLGINPLSPSLDRRDPSKGYTFDNTRLVCTAINIALSNFGEKTFSLIADGFLQRKVKRDNINAAKRTEKSRNKTSKSVSGESNPRAKITENIVKEIRLLAENNECTQVQLSKQFNIPKTTINHIIKRYTWKNI